MFLYPLVCAITFIIWFYIFYVPFKYWQRKNIPHTKPWPVCGNMISVIKEKNSIAELIQEMYNVHSNKRYFGFYQFFVPTLVLRDPELIKKVTVKEFDAFPEHRPIVLEHIDPLIAKNLFYITGLNRWYALRHSISPVFTSSKVKSMFSLMRQSSKHFIEHYQKQNHLVTVEMKDAFTRYTNDIISSTAFGITCNSFQNPTNEFYLMGKKIIEQNGFKSLAIFLSSISPVLGKIAKVTMFPKQLTDYFVNVIKESIALRHEQKIVRADMIHLLMEIKNQQLKNDNKSNEDDSQFAALRESKLEKLRNESTVLKSDDDIARQAFLFYFAGIETSSTAMCFVSYELALNVNIQRKLQNEIDLVLSNNSGEISYDALVDMKYLDAVVSETLRKWPPVPFAERNSVKAFVIEPTRSEELVQFEKGTTCWIPTYAIHRDPQYYPDPEVFDPERFTDENKHKIKPFTYMPFGIGPRGCIGTRFALLEIKLIIFSILQNFNIFVIEKTQVPFKQLSKGVFLGSENGFWLGLETRS